MRPIYLARMPQPDKVRPVVVMTRESVRNLRRKITVAPITSTIRGLSTEVPVGPANGLDHDSVVLCDSIATLDAGDLIRLIGHLLDDQEKALADAIVTAFDLSAVALE